MRSHVVASSAGAEHCLPVVNLVASHYISNRAVGFIKKFHANFGLLYKKHRV